MTPEPALNLDFTNVEEPEREEMHQSDTTPEIKTTIKGVGEVLPFRGREREVVEKKAESFDSTEDETSKLFFESERDYTRLGTSQVQQPSQEFIMIMRSHFVNPILKSLQLMQPFAGTSAGAAYIADILNNIHRMAQRSPSDGFIEILLALYDSLAFQGQWVTYNSDQFNNAYAILKKYAERTLLKANDVEKAIMEIEDIGFDTTPIPLVIEDEEDKLE